jgi:uncharacterized integral membrane protein
LRLLARILIFLAALIAVVFAVNNRTVVSLDLWPWSAIETPVYALALIAGFAGYCLGGFAAWLNASRWRRRAREAEKRAARAESTLVAREVPEPTPSSTKALPPS